MSFHIGKLIKKQIKAKGWSIKKFSDEANMTYRNALYLFDRTDISVQQLQHISKVLDYDFVNLYNEEKKEVIEEQKETIMKGEQMATLSFTFGIAPAAYDSLSAFMKDVNDIADKYGIKVL